MAWKDTLLDATFRGVRLHVLNTDDQAQRSLVRHEYPYRDGAEVEDLGRRARTIHVQAIVWGKEYETDLRKLLEALDKPGPGELIHPVFGSITACVANVSVTHHEDEPDSARVILDLVESSPDVPFFAGGRSPKAKAAGNADRLAGALDWLKALNLAAVQKWGNKLSATLSQVARGDLLGAARGVFSEAASLAGVTLPVMPDFLSQGQSLMGTAQSLVSSVSALASMPDVFGQFASLSGLSGLLPRFDLGTAGKSTPYAMTPARYSGTPVSGPLTGEAAPRPVVVVPPVAESSTAPAPDMATAAGQGRAMAAATLNLASAMAVASASSDVLTSQIAAPALTPAEVEAVVGVSRQRFQDVIDEHRAIFPTEVAYPIAEQARTAALALQDLGSQVIRLHPPVVAQTAPAPCNLHLMAHWLYGDFTRAGELLRLNPGLRNPNFVAPGQVLNGYAK
uniref:DNA circulation family protein n=1 Tax=Fundidesulfovibrio putealis TaxID=270496 RepID=A0A7C4EK77_9BACT